MKRLDRFILKSFIGPFVAILLVVMFILVMQFLWVYIDELVGKSQRLHTVAHEHVAKLEVMLAVKVVFDKNITDEIVTEIAKQKPYYAVFRDSGITSDSVMTNFEQIFETYSPKTQRKVL